MNCIIKFPEFRTEILPIWALLTVMLWKGSLDWLQNHLLSIVQVRSQIV